jgi:DMSO/TMAO reductase YedYZ molybdopterin-dependent catalytic subunit
MTVELFSTGARIAGPGEGIGAEELQLATRNHGLPLEALRYDVTPPGLHYVLVHYDIPSVDAHEWRLQLDGCLEQPVTMDLDELRALPSRTVRVTMECAGNGRARYEPRPVSQPWLVEAVGTAEWTGVPLADLLELVRVRDDAVDVVFTGADHGVERGVEQDYQRALSMAEAMDGDVLVAFEMNGRPIPPQHGFPVRLVVPGWYGMAHVKWLTSIEVLDHTFEGFQNAVAYRMRSQPDDPGTPVTRIEPRALLEPPGFPDFMSRTRFVHPGPVMLRGRCWSGWAPVSGVEVSADGGTTWLPATLEPDLGSRWAWRRFSCEWNASPGEHVLTARATDSSGRVQPMDASWNRGGFANNSAQLIHVVTIEP